MFPIPKLDTPLTAPTPSEPLRRVSSKCERTFSDDTASIWRSFPSVYEPAEDTYLFLDSLLHEIPSIITAKPVFLLEMGSGSGCIITYLMQLLQRAKNDSKDEELCECFGWAADINALAAKQTLETVTLNKLEGSVDVVTTDLFNGFRETFLFDLIVFNPPYVPSTQSEAASRGIDASWAGGENGRQIIDLFLPNAIKQLSPNGRLYLLMEQQNKEEEVVQYVSNLGFTAAEVLKRRAMNEVLTVWRFLRKEQQQTSASTA